MHRIKGTTKLLGVLGYPVEHSLSPIMHNEAIASLNADYIYVPFSVKPEQLETAIAGFAAMNVAGFSITIPHKQAIIPLLAEISPIAQTVGAVNTVFRTNRGWYGTNTDVEGFIAPLQDHHQWGDKIAVILGNGGAARAVVAGCHQLGCVEIHVVGRNEQKLREFHQSWLDSSLGIKINVHSWENLGQLLPTTSLLVNTTPIGMYPHINATPISTDLMTKLKAGAIAYDLIYTPKPTQFLQIAATQGARTIDGLEMLVQQGAAALRMWLNQEVPIDIMRNALLKALGEKNQK
jgi:shikimate dehydrogenase